MKLYSEVRSNHGLQATVGVRLAAEPSVPTCLRQ